MNDTNLSSPTLPGWLSFGPFKKFRDEYLSCQQELVDYRGQVEALGKSQGVIEFNLDGTIITANDNFLAVVGYTLEEIQGQHHSMFADAAYKNSAEYQQFWKNLNDGKFDAGEYKRIGKGGKEVWIQASYNPIFDQSGKPYKVVKYASDVTEQKLAAADSVGQLEAIDKSQGVIEFNMDGTVRTANQNFLNVIGYSLDEIRGQHHSMFVLPEYRSSAEYTKFWADLNRGEYQAAEYERVGKGGKEIWIQASYNPIFDMNGTPFKVVKYATDTTEQKLQNRAQESIVAETLQLFSALSNGDLDCGITKNYEGVFDQLKRDANKTVAKLREVVGSIHQATSSVSTGAGELSEGNANLSQRTEEQASSLEETASSMEQITSTVVQNADNAKQANQLATQAREQAETGGSVVSNAVNAMNEINDSSKKISDIIGVIDEIAFQTNLLALNASVEAARAGEQGRGFAVVASEVRNLAGRSATAAKEIKELIQDSASKVDEGSRLVNESGETLEEIVGAVKKVTDIVAEISAASQEQSQGIEQVNKAVTQLDEMTQQNAALVEEAASSSAAMSDESHKLSDLISFFSMGDSASTNANSVASGEVSVVALANDPQRGGTPPVETPKRVAAGGGSDEWEQF